MWIQFQKVITTIGGDLCLKFYRVPRNRMRCVTIVLVKRRCAGCKNKRSSLLETTCIYKDFNGFTCVLFVCGDRTVYMLLVLGQNRECVDGTSTKLWMLQNVILKSKRVPEYNKFQGRLKLKFQTIICTSIPRNINYDGIYKWSKNNIPRNYPVPKCLCKQGTMNTNIIKERRMSSTTINIYNIFISNAILLFLASLLSHVQTVFHPPT